MIPEGAFPAPQGIGESVVNKKLLVAVTAAFVALGIGAPVANAATGQTVTLVRADQSTVTVPLRSGSDGVKYAVDPQAAAAHTKAMPGFPEGTALTITPDSVQANDCFTGEVCLYTDAGWSGIGIAFPAGTTAGDLRVYGFDNLMSSWKNFSGINYCWSFDLNNTGERHQMLNGIAVNVTAHENDQATSLTANGC